MINLIPCEPVIVAFQGRRAADGPLTFGQRDILQWLDTLPTLEHGWIRWSLDLPEAAGVDDVRATIAALLERHEGLRTSYATSPQPVQRVAGAGQLTLHVYAEPRRQHAEPARGTELGQRLKDLRAELGRRLDGLPPSDPRDDPLRVALAVRDGVVIAGVVDCSHVACDQLAVVVLAREFAEMVRNPSARAVRPAEHQPLDQAEAERAGPLLRSAETSLERWRNWLREAPQCAYPSPRISHRVDSVAAELNSYVAAQALSRIVARTGLSRSGAVLAALCLLLHHRTSYPVCHFTTLSANRFGPRLEQYVGTLVQTVPVTVRVGSATSFDDLVRRAWAAVIRAGRFGMYDVRRRTDIAKRIQSERGIRFCFEPMFNNLEVDSAAAGTADERWPEPADSVISWSPMPAMPMPLRFDLFQSAPSLRLRLWTGFTDRVCEAEVEALLLAVERLLLAASVSDLCQDGMHAAVGMGPLALNSNWLRVGSCPVEISEVRQLVREALSPTPAAVFPTVDGRQLVAYLAADPTVVTPAQAHARCLAGLAGRPNAMAPQYYVVCVEPPEDHESLEQWRGVDVVAEGAGWDETDRPAGAVAAAQFD